MAPMSQIFSVGLVGDSIQTIRASGLARNLASSASTSPTSTRSKCMPHEWVRAGVHRSGEEKAALSLPHS
eukprot:15436349-Alexandrium_andersonii.AAC.1